MSIKLTFPQGREVDKAFVDFAERMLSDAGVSQAQADQIATAWQSHVDQWMQTDSLRVEAAREQEFSALRNQWGNQLDSHVSAGRRAAASLGLDAKALDALDRTIGIGATMSLLAKIGSRVTTDAGTSVTKINVTDPAAAKAEIAKLQGDRAFQDQLRDVKNPTARADALAKWNDLHAAAYPAPEAAPAPSTTPAPVSKPAANNTPSKSEAARTRIEQLKGDAAFKDSLFNKADPRHTANVETWNILHQEAFPPPEQGVAQ